MPLTHYTQIKLLEHLFNVASYLAPTVYLGISTTAPARNGTGVTEPSGMGYTRMPVWTWAPVTETLYPSETPHGRSSHFTRNTSSIVFPAATGTWISGSGAHQVFYDAPTGGNLLYYTAMTTFDGPVTAGKVVTLPTDSVQFNFNGTSHGLSWTPHICKAMFQHLLGHAVYSPPTWHLGMVTAVNVANETYTEFVDASYARQSTSGYWPAATTDAGGFARLDFTGATMFFGPVVGAGASVWPVLFEGSSGPLAAYLGIHGSSFIALPHFTGDTWEFRSGGLQMLVN